LFTSLFPLQIHQLGGNIFGTPLPFIFKSSQEIDIEPENHLFEQENDLNQLVGSPAKIDFYDWVFGSGSEKGALHIQCFCHFFLLEQ